ncbi:MAG: single-stranded DNA-binding protein [Bacillota bacterium]
MLNQINLIGRLTRDPELLYTSAGQPLASFALAVERSFKNKEGKKDVDFIEIRAWQRLAEVCADNLRKGRLVAVAGRLQVDKNTKGSRTYENARVIAREVNFLDWPAAAKPEVEELIEVPF